MTEKGHYGRHHDNRALMLYDFMHIFHPNRAPRTLHEAACLLDIGDQPLGTQ